MAIPLASQAPSFTEVILGSIGAAITVMGTIVSIISYIESKQRNLWWRYDSEGGKILGLAGEHYLFYGRTLENNDGYSFVKALIKIDHHPTILMSWTKIPYIQNFSWVRSVVRRYKKQRTSLRLLAPRSSDDIEEISKKMGYADPFLMYLKQDFSDSNDDVFDIRGDVYFDRDYFFTDCEGVNNFEKLNHIGHKSKTGRYRIFILLGAFLDVHGRPSASECICVKRRYFESATPEQIKNFNLAMTFLRRDGIPGQHSHMMHPLLLPAEDSATNEILPRLRRQLGIP